MSATTQPFVIPVWPDGAPGSEEWTHQEQETDPRPPYNIKLIRNVVQPTLTAYLPDSSSANGTAVVVCPGGAFHFLAIEHEGTDVANWLNQQGIAAFVLRYRLIQTSPDDEQFTQQVRDNMADRDSMNSLMSQIRPIAVADGLQALRLLRERAAEWGIMPDRIGIVGFSAGGVVTIGTALQYDAASRPDFAAPIYPAPWGEIVVPKDAPPLFVAVANDDPFAASACIPLHTAWSAAGHSSELHIYATGGHGFGMHKHEVPSDSWIERFGDWLAMLGMLSGKRG